MRWNLIQRNEELIIIIIIITKKCHVRWQLYVIIINKCLFFPHISVSDFVSFFIYLSLWFCLFFTYLSLWFISQVHLQTSYKWQTISHFRSGLFSLPQSCSNKSFCHSHPIKYLINIYCHFLPVLMTFFPPLILLSDFLDLSC